MRNRALLIFPNAILWASIIVSVLVLQNKFPDTYAQYRMVLSVATIMSTLYLMMSMILLSLIDEWSVKLDMESKKLLQYKMPEPIEVSPFVDYPSIIYTGPASDNTRKLMAEMSELSRQYPAIHIVSTPAIIQPKESL